MGYDEDLVIYFDDFGKFVGNYEDGVFGIGNSINKLVDFDFGVDVDIFG